MDGVFRRVPVEGDKDGQTGGAYVGYPDGHPAGYICNFRTGIEINWKAEGESKGLSDIDRVRLHEEARARQEKKVLDRAERHEQTSRRLEDELTRLPPAAADHPYLVRKGLAGDAGVLRQDQQGNLVIPAGDSDGRIWTVQRINGDGRKGFEKDGALAGHYNVTVTGQAAGGLGRKGPIVITEGWATGETIRRATGATVVTAFTAKNLAAVAKALREKHPDRPILIAGDNDHLKKRNVGLEAARDAANATNGHYLVPQFAPGSKGTDWNDYYLEFGEKALKQQIAEGIVLADRRRLATAQLTQEDGERVAEQIRQNQAKVEQLAPGAVLSVQRGQMEGLRQQARREAEVQDKSDENINSLDPEAVKKRAGRSRSRVA